MRQVQQNKANLALAIVNERNQNTSIYMHDQTPLAPGDPGDQSNQAQSASCALAQYGTIKPMAAALPPPVELPQATRATLAKMAGELGMTNKQFAFASLVVSGLSQSEAYRRVYDSEPDSKIVISSEASKVAKNPRVATAIEAGRASLNYLRAESGAKTRELIARGFDEGLEKTLESGDYATFGQLAKVAGTQRHVQAFAAVGADAEAKALTDITEAISSFVSELQESGIQPIDVTYTVACSESQQNVKSVRYLPLVDEDDLDWCIPGAD